MGNSCPPCQCNTESVRPYYDIMKLSLKQLQCMPENPTAETHEEFNQCVQKYTPDMMAALKTTKCKDADPERGEIPKCLSELPQLEKVQVLKECNEAILDYLNEPNARTSVIIGQSTVPLDDFCAMLINNKTIKKP